VNEVEIFRCGLIDKVLSVCWDFEDHPSDPSQPVQVVLELAKLLDVTPG